MTRIPRLLPLVAVAIGGVLAVNALAGAKSLPDLFSSARAFAEEAAKPAKGKAEKGEKAKAAADAKADAETDTKAQSPMPDTALVGAATAAAATAPVCAPSAAELASQAGLSPAELQVLQSLGARRGQLDQRESDLDVQLKLLAAAEAKLDAKLKALGGLKGDIQGLLGQADAQSQAETQRLVRVYEAMKPKTAAAQMAVLSDAVRLPIAAKMKERSLSAVLGAMTPAQARDLTEKLAQRYAAADPLNQARAAVAPPAAAAAAKPGATAAAAPPAAKPKPA
jgi:flagellar motility protein MotE (MotC chaperone)